MKMEMVMVNGYCVYQISNVVTVISFFFFFFSGCVGSDVNVNVMKYYDTITGKVIFFFSLT